MQEPSIFTRILHGEIFQEIIFEDDTCFVILTNEPLSPGHCLVIPKQEITQLWELPDDMYHHVWSIAKQMAAKLTEVFGYARIGMAIDGFGVPQHAHLHVFGYIENGLEPTIIRNAASKKPTSSDELKDVADKLRA